MGIKQRQMLLQVIQTRWLPHSKRRILRQISRTTSCQTWTNNSCKATLHCLPSLVHFDQLALIILTTSSIITYSVVVLCLADAACHAMRYAALLSRDGVARRNVTRTLHNLAVYSTNLNQLVSDWACCCFWPSNSWTKWPLVCDTAVFSRGDMPC